MPFLNEDKVKILQIKQDTIRQKHKRTREAQYPSLLVCTWTHFGPSIPLVTYILNGWPIS